MRYRLIIFAITVLSLCSLVAIDTILPWPALCVLLSLTLLIMTFHSFWLLHAQSKERRKLKTSRDSSWQPSVDILIPAKNESRVIERTVRGFCELDYPDFRVWVIDDASDDNTPQILERLRKELPNFNYIRRPQGSYPGKSAGLNDALPHCRAEVIAVFDADASVDKDFLSKILPVLEPDGVGAVQSQKRIYPHQKGLLPSCQASEYALDTYFQVGRDLIGGAVELRGNGQLIKREALIDVGGWNNAAITDDLDLTMRLMISNWALRFSPDTHVFEEAVTTVKGLIRQRRRWAEGSIRRYLDYIFPLNSPSRLSLVERLDILAFLSEFAIPGFLVLEVLSEIVSFFLMGEPIHPKFLFSVAALTFIISLVNFFIAIRTYRKELSFWEAFFHTFEVNSYVYAHWVPCIVISFVHIGLRRQASTWHRTEHLGESLESVQAN
ncbi:MAG: glycosyltransferase family 2 protein [Candidatus Obscuribacterales bacterium]|nr:glycosyltransferase family 2 protein [Candidatus Obscuribacterales bacterium]